MIKKSKKNGGYILVLSVLFIGALATTVTISSLMLGMGGLRSGFDIEQGHQAKALADLCAEEALRVIQEENDYSGSETIQKEIGECTYSVINTGGETRSISSEGQVNNVSRHLELSVSKISPSITISTWEESISGD